MRNETLSLARPRPPIRPRRRSLRSDHGSVLLHGWAVVRGGGAQVSEPEWSLPFNRAELIARCEVLERIAEVAARLDMLLADDEGDDVGTMCETEDELHEALK